MARPTAQETLHHGGCLTYDSDEPNVFYHCTPTKNVDSILKNGLSGGLGRTFNTLEWSKDRIFLSLGYEEAVQWQGVIAEETGEDTAILQIKLTKKEIKNLQLDLKAYGDGFACSFYTRDKFSAARISVADTGEGTGANVNEALRVFIKSIVLKEIRQIKSTRLF